jgi:type III restriction enzyme
MICRRKQGMSNRFFERPILNSPYEIPKKHWELDPQGQPTQRIVEMRRRADLATPIPKPKKRKGARQKELELENVEGVDAGKQQAELTAVINEIRGHVDRWRSWPNEADWQVTPETARLLKHWRHYNFSGPRPFFCQVEAVETVIWLTEVAPRIKDGKRILEHLEKVNLEANPQLSRLALKLATGAGKTTVMAMLIAWQAVNASRRRGSKSFTRGFLIVAPGLTIKDRLRVLLPNDLNNYYTTRELVPADMLQEVGEAKIVITNYHAFKLRERLEVASGTRALLKGRTGEDLDTLETEGQMLQRVMPALMGMKNILVLNDEAHHCYREKPSTDEDDDDFKGEERIEAEENNEAARVWISGLEMVNQKLGLSRVIDLSATPFFLRGSGYPEGTLFPWTMSDFSLMDAIECGIVKLPRVPVAENIPGNEMPVYRNLWDHLDGLPKQKRASYGALDPLKIPMRLQTAIHALYGHYEKTFEAWQAKRIKVPPCFIIVCQNTAISKLLFDYVSGFYRTHHDGTESIVNGQLKLFRNFDENLQPVARPNAILIDSAQLEAGDALDATFRAAAADEIERFKEEIRQRTNDPHAAENITDQDLLREVMNTVGKPGALGGGIRCVVSVSMLTEGWDANTVTHILGVRAFGTQLLCEQVIGRALRRQSYDLNEEGLFDVEYADIFGIPFDFTAQPVIAPVQPPRETTVVKAMSPERDALEIRFPRVVGYRTDLPEENLRAEFKENSILELNPDLVGPTMVRNEGIIGKAEDFSIEHLDKVREAQLLFNLARHLVETKYRDPGEPPKLYLFGQLKEISRQWLRGYLRCKGSTYPGLLMYRELADMACNKIVAAISDASRDEKPIRAMLDPYNATGSSRHVRMTTTKDTLWTTSSQHCHVNFVVYDSDWEAEFCRVAESHSRVKAYVKNHGLQFEVPYRYGSETRIYRPDFIVHVDDGHGENDLLNLIVEIKGYRREDAREKKLTMDSYWIPGVNQLGAYGRWAFAEFRDVFEIQTDFEKAIENAFNTMIEKTVHPAT